METNAEHASPALRTPPVAHASPPSTHHGRGRGAWGDGDAADGQSRASSRIRRRLIHLIRIVLVVLLAWLALLAGRAWNKWASPTPPPIRGVLPGEFETCEAILLRRDKALGGRFRG